MFDLDLIERALDDAVADAAELLARKLREYAGREDNPHVALYRNAVILEKDARAEFAKLRKAVEEAPRACVNVNADEETGMFWAHVTAAVQDKTMNHTSVLLVKCDD